MCQGVRQSCQHLVSCCRVNISVARFKSNQVMLRPLGPCLAEGEAGDAAYLDCLGQRGQVREQAAHHVRTVSRVRRQPHPPCSCCLRRLAPCQRNVSMRSARHDLVIIIARMLNDCIRCLSPLGTIHLGWYTCACISSTWRPTAGEIYQEECFGAACKPLCGSPAATGLGTVQISRSLTT